MSTSQKQDKPAESPTVLVTRARAAGAVAEVRAQAAIKRAEGAKRKA